LRAFTPVYLQQRLKFISQVKVRTTTPLILTPLGFLFTSYSGRSNSLACINGSSELKAQLNIFRLSFFTKLDLKRLLLRKGGNVITLSTFFDKDGFLERGFFLYSSHTFNFLKDSNKFFYTTKTPYIGTNIERGFDNYRPIFTSLYKFSDDRYYNSQDFFLKKVRFKPGYQRVWRRARLALNYLLHFNTRYQAGLTRRLVRMRRMRSLNSLKLVELKLNRTILSSHFVFDLQTANLVIQSKLVFINGINVNNNSLQLFIGDFLQIIISLRYYTLYRWLIYWGKQSRLKLHRLVAFKANSSKFDLSKQVSAHLPDWILLRGVFSFDIPKYLEVDFLTLSTYILYEPLAVSDLTPSTYLISRAHLYSIYN